MQTEAINLGSCIVIEVDDDIPEWLTEEQGYKPYTGPPTVSKRQHRRGLGPPINIGAFNNIEDLEKDYLHACQVTYSLTPPFIERRRG